MCAAAACSLAALDLAACHARLPHLVSALLKVRVRVRARVRVRVRVRVGVP